MASFCLKLGAIDKKLIMVIVSTILYFVMDIIEYFTEMSTLHYILDFFYARAISYVIIIIVPLIQKWRNKNLRVRQKGRNCKRIACDLFYIYLTYIFYFTAIIYLKSLKAKDPKDTEDYQMSHYKGFCFEEALEIVFIVIVSKFLLKMKLYMHHYVGLLIFLILSIGIDLLCNISLLKPDFFFIFIYILHLIFDSIYITYEKYMMDKLGYSPFIVVFLISFMFFFAGTVGVIILTFTGSVFYDGKDYQMKSLEDYFDNNDYRNVILHIVYLVVFRFFINILKILTVYYFSQIHTFATYIIIKMFNLILNKDSKYRYYSLILFVFQFLGLLIFLEIIEINFCNLDKNTKRNVERRGAEESFKLLSYKDNDDDDEFEIVEVAPGYVVETEMATVTKEDNEDHLEKTTN